MDETLGSAGSGLDMQTRFLPGKIHLTGTTMRSRRLKSRSQHTLNIENVGSRRLHEPPTKICVHPPNKPSSTYKITNPPPDRMFCSVERSRAHDRYGGESMKQDPNNDWWDRGEYWNRDSNIRQWTFQESRRQAAQGSHDVHRHDQINPEKLASDRENMVDLFKTWIPPRGNDDYDPKPPAARQSCGVHQNQSRACDEYGYCFDGDGVRPMSAHVSYTAVMTKKYKKMGEAAFRERGTWQI